jgi:hypothetical protein
MPCHPDPLLAIERQEDDPSPAERAPAPSTPDRRPRRLLTNNCHVHEFLDVYPEWRGDEAVLFWPADDQEGKRYPMAPLSVNPTAAFVQWERRRGYLTKVEANELVLKLGLL